MMKILAIFVVTIIYLLVAVLTGSGTPAPEPVPTSTPIPPTATPVVFEPNYTNSNLGLSIWYPDDWAHDEYAEEVIFANSEEIIDGAEVMRGAAMMLARRELTAGQTIEELVETTLSELTFAEVETSDQKHLSIGGQPGVIVTLEGRPQGAPVSMRGFLAGAEHRGWGYLFVAVSTLDEWSIYGPTLQTMLDSACFERTEPIYTNPDLGLSMHYPEDWLYEEQGDQVIFGSSPEVVSDGKLEAGAALVVLGSKLGDPPRVDEMVETVLSELSSEGMEVSSPEPRAIGDEQAIIVTFAGTPQGLDSPVRGFLAAAEHEGWGYVFVGLSALDRWCDHGPSLETMLDSVQFTK